MAHSQDEATKAVSAALSEVNGDLLAAIDVAQEQWRQDLAAAKSTARQLLTTVLGERESLRTSLETASELWRVLGSSPSTELLLSHEGKLDTKNASSDAFFLANDSQIETVTALQNVSHTITYLEFILACPEALTQARNALSKLLEDGLDQVIPGNAAKLVESHATLTAVERLRDIILLESPDLSKTDSSMSWFSEAMITRDLLEDLVLRQIFSNVIRIAQCNPRLLVAAARVVESEEAEDEWWTTHLLRRTDEATGENVRSFGTHSYRKRALEAVMESLHLRFTAKYKELGLLSTAEPATGSSKHAKVRSLSVDISNVLDWIELRRADNDTVRRFVVPCLPPSFSLGSLYERELHRQFMRLITRVLHLTDQNGLMVLSDGDLMNLTSWYCKYRTEIGDNVEDIDCFLGEEDRERLISALQKHCESRISEKITIAIETDRNRSRSAFDLDAINGEDVQSSQAKADAVLRRSDLPDVVLGCINEQVRRMLALKIQGMDQAIAETAAKCLVSFQGEVLATMVAEGHESSEECYRLYACATANNMARCLEYSEDLRDLFIPLASDKDRSEIEGTMERVIEGFRAAATRALKVLISGVEGRLKAHASRLYSPCTGTEIMLDIVATLEDYFSDYEPYLLPYHFEHLALESLKRVVVWYLAPFLRVGQKRMEESAARRFTSLPTFDEMSSMALEVPPEDHGVTVFGRSSGIGADKLALHGISSLNGAAVVAQIEKDRANLSEFMGKKIVLYQKKQLQPTLEPLEAIRSLYTCPTTTFGLSDAFRDAKIVISRALRPSWVSNCGVSGNLTIRLAEIIWESRKDVNPVVLLEAVSVIRSLGDKIDPSSSKDTRMASFDDGRFLGSRNSDIGGPFSERMLGNDGYMEQGVSSSSLLWAPSTSRSSRSRKD